MASTKPKSDAILFFLKGIASAFDITGQTLIDDFSGGFERDARVLCNDWKRVENDLRKAMGQVVHGQY